MTQEFLYPIRVYIEDTDAGGIVYYANYLKYFERGRTEFLRSLGFEKAALSSVGRMFIVSKLVINYLRPARLDDSLHVTVLVQKVGGATIDFTQSVRKEREILVDGAIKIACLDELNRRPVRLESSLREKLSREQSLETRK